MRKTLQELTIKNSFLFGAVMLDENNCKDFLEMVLKIRISKIRVLAEKSIVYNPEYKGVRLDIEAEDEFHTHYDVEMQVNRKETLLRSRYYHSQMDVELLASGTPYESLPSSYVIFICDYDPFDLKKYQYTITQKCEEAPELDVSAGVHTIFLSTRGENDEEVSEELRKFLKYVGSGLEDSEADFQDAYVRRLQETVRKIKKDREMGERYMILEELLRDEREEGRKEGLKEGRKEGLKEGIEKGIREGLEEGRKEERICSIRYILEAKKISLTEEELQIIEDKKEQEELQDILKKAAIAQSKEEFLAFLIEK